MGAKEAVGNGYIEEQKKLHAWKPTRDRNRRAVVVGDNGTDNVGRAVTLKLIDAGFSVVPTYYREEERRDGLFFLDAAEPGTFFDKLAFGGGADVLVLCNGTTALDWVEDQTRETEVLRSVLLASVRATGAFVRATLDAPYRKYVVYVGSMAYRSVLNGSSVYCAAKAGLVHYARCAAWELAPKGYCVSVVNPSNVEGTPMTRKTVEELARYRGLSAEEAEAYWSAVLPTSRFLRAADVAEVVGFLVSGRADFLSGSALDLAGGQR